MPRRMSTSPHPKLRAQIPLRRHPKMEEDNRRTAEVPMAGGGVVEPTSTWAQQAAFYIYVFLMAIFARLILDRVEKKASIWPLAVVGAANCALLILVQFLADQTSVWAYTMAWVASCVLASLTYVFLRLIVHHVIQWLTSRQNNALFVAIERVRIELLLLFLFASTLLYKENYITQVCISAKAVSLILTRQENEIMDYGSSCPNGKVPLVSVDGLHHICVFIYFLAFFRVTYSFLIIVLGRAKIREWKEWEKETLSPSYKFSSDHSRFRFPQETIFVKQHTTFSNTNPILFYTACFFHQFFKSVHKTEYLIMRHGFLTGHLAPGSDLDFQEYINRSLEDDFKLVVRVSPKLWASAVLFILLNVTCLQTMFWISLIPLTTILTVGTILQTIITKIVFEIQVKHKVIQGVPSMHLCNQHLWFGEPYLILYLIRFMLFQNAFQIVYLLSIWYKLEFCFHCKLIILRLCLVIGIHFWCSYITLPTYALVSQMGPSLKKHILKDIIDENRKN